jgi:RNA polymerase sigma-70 factor (ECF subfamily)
LNRVEVEEELARHHEAAFGWALVCCRWDRTEAEDVLHTAYLRILDGKARFEGRSTFRTWLFGTIRLTEAELRRRRWLGMAALARWATQPRAAAPDQAAELESTEETRALRAALLSLSPRQREMLHLVFYQDLTIEDAADVLGMRIGTARTHYARGKESLRRRLETRR